MPELKEVTLESIANEAMEFFVRKTRDDNTNYYCCAENTPEWVKELCRDAHGYKLPDDYVYNWIDSALSHIADGMTEDNMYEYSGNEVDSYTGRLTTWLNSRCDRICYLTQALEEIEVTDGFNALAMAQTQEINEVFSSVLNSIQARLDELTN